MHAHRVRHILDEAGLSEVGIFASGNLDEYRLADLKAKAAPIDGFGIGTRMNTSSDAPYLDCAYKLQMYDGRPKRKTSEGKATLPGAKQVYRTINNGIMEHDLIATADEHQQGKTLLKPMMHDGKTLAPLPELEDIRNHAAEELAQLPDYLRALKPEQTYPVHLSERLQKLVHELDAGTA
jgi:nicotinate phosphoribosyltransferase